MLDPLVTFRRVGLLFGAGDAATAVALRPQVPVLGTSRAVHRYLHYLATPITPCTRLCSCRVLCVLHRHYRGALVRDPVSKEGFSFHRGRDRVLRQHQRGDDGALDGRAAPCVGAAGGAAVAGPGVGGGAA